MILVLLGTHELPFTRLLKEVELLKVNHFIEEEIIVQNGNTPYNSPFLSLRPFVSYEEMSSLVNEAKLIITHAGTGSIVTSLKQGKKVIAAPRLKKYGEHNDDHQLEIVNSFVQKGYLLVWNDGDNLEQIIKEAEHFHPIPFHSEKSRMLSLLKDFIEHA